jgi:hypothetical protein
MCRAAPTPDLQRSHGVARCFRRMRRRGPHGSIRIRGGRRSDAGQSRDVNASRRGRPRAEGGCGSDRSRDWQVALRTYPCEARARVSRPGAGAARPLSAQQPTAPSVFAFSPRRPPRCSSCSGVIEWLVLYSWRQEVRRGAIARRQRESPWRPRAEGGCGSDRSRDWQVALRTYPCAVRAGVSRPGAGAARPLSAQQPTAPSVFAFFPAATATLQRPPIRIRGGRRSDAGRDHSMSIAIA